MNRPVAIPMGSCIPIKKRTGRKSSPVRSSASNVHSIINYFRKYDIKLKAFITGSIITATVDINLIMISWLGPTTSL